MASPYAVMDNPSVYLLLPTTLVCIPSAWERSPIGLELFPSACAPEPAATLYPSERDPVPVAKLCPSACDAIPDAV